jgi:5-(carboxyamino)imidazole ribonucleotide synthase
MSDPIAFPQPVLELLPLRQPRATLTLGIVGGGQLAKMTAQAALQLGCDIAVLEKNNHSPAANLTTHHVLGDWDNPESLLKLGSLADVVTLENEFVDANSLAVLEQFGYPLWPTSKTIGVVQDKLTQKQAFADAGLPMPRFAPAPDKASVAAAASQFGWPLLLKKRRCGYDGKGNATVNSTAEIDSAWSKLGGGANDLYVEEFCPFTTELAIMITRSREGGSVIYPLVETVQHDHICHIVKAPAPVSADVADRAAAIAQRAVNAVGGVGSIGIELFLTAAGEILINEMAPRVHNSGHYTIEACVCSQFENHVRAVLGWPLGPTTMRAPAAVMINLLGAGKGAGAPHGLEHALAVPGAHVHIYGKTLSAPGRKMGHVTALGMSIEEALDRAQLAASLIRFGNPQ